LYSLLASLLHYCNILKPPYIYEDIDGGVFAICQSWKQKKIQGFISRFLQGGRQMEFVLIISLPLLILIIIVAVVLCIICR
jgi:hypothetical protein